MACDSADAGASAGVCSGLSGAPPSPVGQHAAVPQPAVAADAAPPPEGAGTHSFRLLVAYDGTAYSGWQLQPSAPTIQGQFERVLSTVLREPRGVLAVTAAGRTDAGVHARGQVVQFRTHRPGAVQEMGLARLVRKLNSLLPHDIRVSWAAATAPDFNVTCTATGKIYHYHMDTRAVFDPLTLRTRAHIPVRLDIAAMRAGAAALVGTHDFTQFSNNSPERLRRNPVKELRRLEVLVTEGGMRLEVEGSGFLYKQVRHMVGVLLALGEGKLQVQDIQRRLGQGSTTAPGAGGAWRGYNVAPAKGLCLQEVHYPPGVDDPSSLLYPELRHDGWGRLLAGAPGEASED